MYKKAMFHRNRYGWHSYQLKKSSLELNVNACVHGYGHDENARAHSRKQFCILHFLERKIKNLLSL